MGNDVSLMGYWIVVLLFVIRIRLLPVSSCWRSVLFALFNGVPRKSYDPHKVVQSIYDISCMPLVLRQFTY